MSPLVRVRLEVDQRPDRDRERGAPRADRRGEDTAREYTAERRRRDRERAPDRFSHPADRPALLQRLAAMSGQSRGSQATAGQVLGTAAQAARAVGSRQGAEMIARAAPVAAATGAALDVAERLPGIIVAAISGLTGLNINPGIAHSLASTIRGARTNIDAAFTAADRSYQRAKSRLLLGGEVDGVGGEVEAFQAISQARAAWRSKVEASIDESLAKALTTQVSGRAGSADAPPAESAAQREAQEVIGREGLGASMHSASLAMRRAVSQMFGGGP